jgi:hypothetical protein
MTRLGDETVRACWQLLSEGQALRALERAEAALRSSRLAPDSPLAGRLLLVVGVSLHALGCREAAQRYLADASWALEAAGETAPAPGEPARGAPERSP